MRALGRLLEHLGTTTTVPTEFIRIFNSVRRLANKDWSRAARTPTVPQAPPEGLLRAAGESPESQFLAGAVCPACQLAFQSLSKHSRRSCFWSLNFNLEVELMADASNPAPIVDDVFGLIIPFLPLQTAAKFVQCRATACAVL